MATTTNYGWTTPDNTAYVKDGASAIRSLGSAIDTTSATTNAAGLVFIKSQAVGSAVSSVSITGAFSASYDSYKIIYSAGVASASVDLVFALTGISTGSYSTLIYNAFNAGGVAGANSANAASFSWTGAATTANTHMDLDVVNPFNAKTKIITAVYNSQSPTGNVGSMRGYNTNTTSCTAFTVTPSSGTLTGGTIYVYGYRKAI